MSIFNWYRILIFAEFLLKFFPIDLLSVDFSTKYIFLYILSLNYSFKKYRIEDTMEPWVIKYFQTVRNIIESKLR